MIHVGDALEVLRMLGGGSVQCCVTSPPYWGLRDYGVPGQLGLEATPAEYVARMVAVFEEVRRVLRADGTLWLNLGDSYAGSWGAQSRGANSALADRSVSAHQIIAAPKRVNTGSWVKDDPTIKPKDLVGIPWRMAFALQDAGWYLRSDIIWAKPNPMPESVTDRPTKSHEYLFLFAKGQRVSRVIQFADLSGERFHLGQHVGSEKPPMRHPGTKFCVALATAIFQGSQAQQDFSLPPFYAEEWKQRSGDADSDFVRGLPVHHRATASAARLLCADRSAEQFMRELNGLRVALTDGHNLLVAGVDTKIALPPTIHRDAEGTITVHDSGEIGKIEFSHGRIIASRPTTCKYFYDASAIAEPVVNPDWTFDQERREQRVAATGGAISGGTGNGVSGGSTRNSRTVWTIATSPFPEAHFATFPPEIPRRCILAGTRHGDTVLDPFAGAGTTGLVASRLGREFVGIELNPVYAEMARRRIHDDAPLFGKAGAA